MSVELNATFKQFVNWAQNKADENATAFAQNTIGQKVSSFTVSEHAGDKIGVAGWWKRTAMMKRENNTTRDIFKNAVIDMFGGLSKIPQAVRKAMELDNFNGGGKPLSARRIMLVKTAIDNLNAGTSPSAGTDPAKIIADSLKMNAGGLLPAQRGIAAMKNATAGRTAAVESAFLNGDGAKSALAAGYRQSELPGLAKTFALFKLATNATDEDAIKAVLDPASKASRLASYGGRFTQTVQSFRTGLDLMDRFAEWYRKLGIDIGQNKFNTPTKVNVTASYITESEKLGYETFVFQDFAIRLDANLDEPNDEKLFGIKNNDAMNFFARGNGHACTGTLLRLSPEKRQVVYAAFRAIEPPWTKNPRRISTYVSDNTGHLARILRHYDEVKALISAGKLDRVSLNKIINPDMPSNYTSQQVSDAIMDRKNKECSSTRGMGVAVANLMNRTGCTLDEAIDAVKTGKKLAELDDIAPTQVTLNHIDGTTKGGRQKILGDLKRPYNVKYAKDNKPVLADENCHFTVKIGGETIRCENGEDSNVNAHIAVKIENLCGKVHVAQANNVLSGLSQSGHARLVPVLAQHGISSQSAEHMPLTYTLSKNDETGAITIHYSEPEGFPFKFSWKTTINVDGFATSTPIEVEEPIA